MCVMIGIAASRSVSQHGSPSHYIAHQYFGDRQWYMYVAYLGRPARVQVEIRADLVHDITTAPLSIFIGWSY